MAVTANPPVAQGFVYGRAPLGAFKSPYIRIRRQRNRPSIGLEQEIEAQELVGDFVKRLRRNA